MLKLFFCILLLIVGVKNAYPHIPKDDRSFSIIESSLSGRTTAVNRKRGSVPLNSFVENLLTIFLPHDKDLHGLHGRNSEMLSNQRFRITIDGDDEARTALAIGFKALKVVKGMEILIGAQCLQMLLRMKNSSQRPMSMILRFGRNIAAAITRIVLQSTSFLIRALALINLLNPTT